MLLQIQTLCYWHWCLEILVVSLKSWLGGQPMGDGQVHHIQTVFLTHSSWDKEAAGGWCQKLCADYSPRSAPAGHPQFPCKNKSILSRWLAPGHRQAMRQ